MRGAISGVIFGAGLVLAGTALACPPPPLVLSEHLGQSVSLEGTLENCKLAPCLQVGDDVVYLRDADLDDAASASPVVVRVAGRLEHDEGSGPAPDGCAARGDCVADVPAHYFIRGATIEPVR